LVDFSIDSQSNHDSPPLASSHCLSGYYEATPYQSLLFVKRRIKLGKAEWALILIEDTDPAG
jgi:hypothetical protein